MKEWELKAEVDFYAINKLSQGGLDAQSAICFHCQQLVEKYLKLYLIHNGKAPSKTHNIELLLAECSDFDSFFDTIDPKNLSDFGVNIRYPGSHFFPSDEETLEYMKIAMFIRSFVRNNVKL